MDENYRVMDNRFNTDIPQLEGILFCESNLVISSVSMICLPTPFLQVDRIPGKP